MTKECRNCREVIPVEGFYRHPQMADGRLNICKRCVCNRVSGHRARNIDKVRSYDRERGRTEERKRRVREYLRANRDIRRRALEAWSERNPDKVRANYAVNNAVRDGRLQKAPCEVCGDSKVQGHHDDYSKPLDVRWLCDTHHKEHHNRMRELKRAA